ncbi:hypothetical protein B14911_27835 [Bacillus sp. NRRL B-14911]|nr:hypothetical protein B14911_27835 [Bacillus sp. NRRL B-14911]
MLFPQIIKRDNLYEKSSNGGVFFTKKVNYIMTSSIEVQKMNITLSIILAVCAGYLKAWKNWRVFHPTMLYTSVLVLLYNFICKDHLLWKHRSIPLESHFAGELFHAFAILPTITVLYLTFYPEKHGRLRYIILWSVLSFAAEFPFAATGMIVFENGYQYWMELLFYPVMYIMIRLHHIRPLVSYGLSAVIILLMVWLFKVPVQLAF